MCQLVQNTINHAIPYKTTLELRGVRVTFLLPISSKKKRKTVSKKFQSNSFNTLCIESLFERQRNIWKTIASRASPPGPAHRGNFPAPSAIKVYPIPNSHHQEKHPP